MPRTRHCAYPLAVALLAASIFAGCTQTGPPQPARLRVANLVQRTPSVRLDICALHGGGCRQQRVAQGELGAMLSLPPARYRVTLHVAGKTLSYFVLGLGADEDYGLALYGTDLPGTSAPGTWAQVTRALGGSDARRVDGYRVTHRLLTLHGGRPSDPATLQLANVAPGTTAFAGQVRVGSQRMDLPAVRYGDIGDAVRLSHPDAVLSLHWPGRKAPLTDRKLHLAGGSSSVAYVWGLEGARPQVLVDTRDP